MATAILRSIASIAIVALAAIINLLGTATAAAQCTTYTVTNNTGCDLTLVVYNAAGATASFDIPSPRGTITLPRGFGAVVGIVSREGTKVPYDRRAGGCTECVKIATWGHSVGCCATVCPDPTGTPCSLVIQPCVSHCIP